MTEEPGQLGPTPVELLPAVRRRGRPASSAASAGLPESGALTSSDERWLLGGHVERDLDHWAYIKFALLSRGAVLEPAADAAMHEAKRPTRTRSGVSGGLDIRIDDSVDVNVPVREAFAQTSPYSLDMKDGQYVITEHEETLCDFTPLPTPSFYSDFTADGTEPLAKIGQMCSHDRLCYGMTGPTCFFWKSDRRCRYCSIGHNYSEDAARKQAKHFIEVLNAAVADGRTPARHVLIGGGTPKGPDMGAILAADLCEIVKSAYPGLSTYVMIAAPQENRYLDLLKSAGADEIGLNLEFWTEAAWEEYIPGKSRLIGKQRYLEALRYVVDLVGAVNARSILIAGLEPLAATKEAAFHLADMGVMPIVSPFRPLEGTMLEDRRGPGPDDYVSLWKDIDEGLRPLGMPLGPTCIACQNNTLALPTDARYRRY